MCKNNRAVQVVATDFPEQLGEECSELFPCYEVEERTHDAVGMNSRRNWLRCQIMRRDSPGAAVIRSDSGLSAEFKSQF
jgi:hypothetical protein